MASRNDSQRIDPPEAAPGDVRSRSAQERLEGIVGPQSSIRSTRVAATVSLVEDPVACVTVNRVPTGTGFLLPGNILLTCQHVIPNKEYARNALINFNHRELAPGEHPSSEGYGLLPDELFETSSDLDWTAVKVDGNPQARWGTLLLVDSGGEKEGDQVTAIHHPSGAPKQYSHGTISQLTSHEIYYTVDTLDGSSGAPIFSTDWGVLAVHKKKVIIEAGRTINLGTRAAAILAALRAKGYNQTIVLASAGRSQESLKRLETTPQRSLAAIEVPPAQLPTLAMPAVTASTPALPVPSPPPLLPLPSPAMPNPRQRRRELLTVASLLFLLFLVVAALTARHISNSGEARRKQEELSRLRTSCDRDNVPSCVQYLKQCEQLCDDDALAKEARAWACIEAAVLLEKGKTPEGTPIPKALARYESACRLGDSEGCRSAGVLYEQGVPKNLTLAFSRYQQACKDGHAKACHDVGLLYLSGVQDGSFHIAPSPTEALRHFIPCTDDVVVSCSSLGYMAETHLIPDGSPALAYTYYDRACRGHEPDGCLNLGGLYQKGFADKPADLADLKKAQGLYKHACDPPWQSPEACVALALLATERDLALPPDSPSAEVLLERGCKHGLEPACFGLAKLLQERTAEARRTEQLLQDSCKVKNEAACVRLARLYQKGHGDDLPANPTAARTFAEESCERKYRQACYLLGQLLLEDKAPGAVQDAAHALRTACEQQEPGACTRLGDLFEGQHDHPRNLDEARKLYDAGCKLRDASACYALAILPHRGREADRAADRAAGDAFKLYRERSQQPRDADARYWQGRMQDSGLGTPRNRPAARKLFAEACRLGLQDACRHR